MNTIHKIHAPGDGASGKRRILVVNTGGTIGMVNTAAGYAPHREAFHRLLMQMPELQSDAMPLWDIVDMDPLLDSSNMTVLEWNAIGEVISLHYGEYDGFVVLHGTDTMAYTASALSFTLRNNAKPVMVGIGVPAIAIKAGFSFSAASTISLMSFSSSPIIASISLMPDM